MKRIAILGSTGSIGTSTLKIVEAYPERFTVVCNYHVVGVLKSAALRWALNGSFNPLEQSVAVGNLSDCVIPQ